MKKSELILPKVRMHDLRHTFGMRLRYAGESEEGRALLLGHATTACLNTMQRPSWSAFVGQVNGAAIQTRHDNFESHQWVAEKESRSAISKSRAKNKALGAPTLRA